ncbi:hypothetical protein I4F81_004215 [Pyropia yezoensis]|uniref:Uncharacterized protein n=1 Tax=Pyropia yezoensis TaxID=2788 RepID=A0ACC3BUB8_PYRYE|nr:hypothetical protein I4F81_004215 [Neopyropia yezoensis]
MGAPPVLTVQVGTYANHVGAHYWNLGDEALGRSGGPATGLAPDGAPFWRVAPAAGRGGGVTLTPAVVMIGAGGGGGGPSGGWHYATAGGAGGGAGGPAAATPADAPNGAPAPFDEDADVVAARRLEDPTAVRYWSDYLKAPLWRHSLLSVGGGGSSAADGAPSSLAAGLTVAAGPASAGDGGDGGGGLLAAAVDRVRRLAEEADRLGGVQLLAESRSGMGAVGGELLAALRDELLSPSTPVLVIGAAPFIDAPAAAAAAPAAAAPTSAAAVAAAAVAADACEGWLLAAAADAGATYVPLTTRGWASAATRRRGCGDGGSGGGWSVTGPGGAWRADPSAAYHSAAILATALDVAAGTPGRRAGAGAGSAGDLASLGDLTAALRPAAWAVLSRPRVCLPLVRAPGLRLSTQLSAGLGRLATSPAMVPLSSAPRRSRTAGSGRLRRAPRRRYGEGADSSDEEAAEEAAAAAAAAGRRHGGGGGGRRRPPAAGTAAAAAGVSVAAQAVCLRGVGLGPLPPDGAPTTAAAAALDGHAAATEAAATAAGRAATAVAAAPVALPVPYPRLFGRMFGPRGEALAVPRRPAGGGGGGGGGGGDGGEWGVELTEAAVLTALTTEGGRRGWSVATADGAAAALRRVGGDGAADAAEALTSLADDYATL